MSKVRILEGVRPADWALAGVLTALGAALMLENATAGDDQVEQAIASGSMVHAMSSHSPAMVPVFVLATVPVLWWRRNLLAVTGIALAVMLSHDVLFGWVTRCGAGLPLAFVLAFLCALTLDGATVWIALATVSALTAAVLVLDATTGFGLTLFGLPILLIVFGVGRAVRHRVEMSRALEARTAELRRLRDERAALEVAGDRARLSRELDGLLTQRLGRLEAAADAGRDLDSDAARDLFTSIENDSRATLEDMRALVTVLRGDDLALAPGPSVANLDALLTRHTGSDSRLMVAGEPRSLPASVELSAYRIVEHLLAALVDRPHDQVEVRVRFDDEAVEVAVRGTVVKAADLRVAVARAKERARLLGGSLEVKVSHGRASAVALLPVTG